LKPGGFDELYPINIDQMLDFPLSRESRAVAMVSQVVV
jgi:hypothetical protein